MKPNSNVLTIPGTDKKVPCEHQQLFELAMHRLSILDSIIMMDEISMDDVRSLSKATVSHLQMLKVNPCTRDDQYRLLFSDMEN